MEKEESISEERDKWGTDFKITEEDRIAASYQHFLVRETAKVRPKMNAFSSRIFRERLEEARKVRWSFWEHQKKGETGSTYSVSAALNEDLLQKLNTEPRGNCVLDHGDNTIVES